jgi:acyl-CoA synthetase (NDP forming)
LANLPEGFLSLNAFFDPASIAVIGATPNFTKPNGKPLELLLNYGYRGQVYPVNPHYEEIAGIRCYPDLKSIPGEVELAIIGVPARLTIPILEDCISKGVKVAIVFTSGFAEVDRQGKQLQQQLAALVKAGGLRLCGPNCMGLINNTNGVMATFATPVPAASLYTPRFFGFISQSGGFGAIIYEMMQNGGIGLNYFVNTGNEADADFTDFWAYMIADPATKIIGAYLEGVRDGQKFSIVAEKARAAAKPLLVLKAGRTRKGAQAALSHTSALAGSDRVYNAFFRQKNIVRVESIEEMVAFVKIFAEGRTPQGNKTAIVSVSGGVGVLLADKCEEAGLEIVGLDPVTSTRLAGILPFFAATGNPVDLTGQFLTEPDLFEKSLKILDQDPHVDVMVVLFALSQEYGERIAAGLVRAYQASKKTMIFICWNQKDEYQQYFEVFRQAGMAVFDEVDHAVRALGNYVAYAQHLALPLAPVLKPYLKTVAPKAEVTDLFVNNSQKMLSEYQAKQVLKAYHIPTTREELATSPWEAVKIAEKIGFPVALKIDSPDIAHKTEVGGVKLNLKSAAEVEAAYQEVMVTVARQQPEANLRGMLVQEMLVGGTELIVGVEQDVVFGPVLMFGLGGIFVEALADVSFRVLPIAASDAVAMVQEIRGYRILEGIRGRAKSDFNAIYDILLKVSQIALDFPDQIRGMDLNPLIVFKEGKGAKVADVLISLK